MDGNGELWVQHRDKAERALEEAQLLFDNGFFDGAVSRSMASCIQMAKAAAVRLGKDDDPPELFLRIRKMTKDGRLAEGIERPFGEIMKAHSQELQNTLENDIDRARESIVLTRTFHRLIHSAMELSISLNSPKVRRAMAARGMKF